MIKIMLAGLAAAVAISNCIGPGAGRNETARTSAAKTLIESFVSALEMYRLHNGVYPTTQQGLNSLVKKPVIAPLPQNYPPEPYMKGIPHDPWGNPFIYRCPGEKGAYDIISTARNGKEGGKGWDADITNHDLFM
jgi:general secretion pathway protein G